MSSTEARVLIDPYLDWTKQEGIPVHEGFSADLVAADTKPWPRLGDGCKGAFVHLEGRGDWMTVFLLELPPGGKSAPQQHLFDEMFYVISGTGSVVVEMPDGGEHTIDWGPRSLFALPLNARYRIINSSGAEPARLACANAFRIVMNLVHNEAFFFDNAFPFPERESLPELYRGGGRLTSIRPGRDLWETNLVPDLASVELRPWQARGAHSSNLQLLLGNGSIGAHVSEMPAGTYKKATRHGPGLHILFIQGSGYTLFWRERDSDFQRVEWRHGVCFAPPDGMFHQHFATGAQPARYLAVAFGTKRYPIVWERRAGSEDKRADVSIKEGGSQIEYADQDPRIHALWLEEIRRNGVQPRI
jgi:mannose-6-phosphate isomerase-like protein (cupin superfamily)